MRLLGAAIIAGALLCSAGAAGAANAGNGGSRYRYTVKGQHVELRCVGEGFYDDDQVFHSTWVYEAQVDGSVTLTDPTDAGLIAQLEAAGVVVTDKAAAYLAGLDCESLNTP